MPSSVTFLIQENSNSSLEKNHMLEYSSDESDDQDQRIGKNQLSKSDDQGEAILLEMEENCRENVSFSSLIESPQKKPLDIDLFSPDELETNLPQPSSKSPIRTRQAMTSKIPIRMNSSSHSRSPTYSRQIPSSARNNGAFHFFTPKDDRKRLASSDDDDGEANQLKEEELKIKLKEQKKHGRKTGELLNQLHENYEELLEKYAQAENTIDQLRFQPKILGDNTPRSVTSEHFIHLTQPAKAHLAALRSSGAYRSTTGSPLSSIRPVASTTTTTTTTPARKSVSPAYSGTIESIVFDDVTPDKFNVQLVIDMKALAGKMKTFLTLMDENQLNLAEQKQVYENIRQDYERLLKDFEQRKRNGQLNVDLTQELESMKQLLKEIVNKITQNLLGKSSIESSPERVNNDISHSSQISTRSSLCNHNDLMNQYEKLLHAVNTTQPEPIRSELNIVTTNPKKQQSSAKPKTKPYVYVSGDSDGEQEDDRIAPIAYTKGVQSTSLGLDYVPSTSVKHHQHRIEERRHENHSPKRREKELRYPSNRTYDYDSGVGTNNLTKMSHESKISPNTMNESHFPSLDDDEQESISSTSSSTRSSGSGSASPGSPYSKRYNKREIYREKPTGHSSKSPYSDSRLSNTDTLLTGSFDPVPSTSHKKKNMHRTHHTWKPQKNTSPLSHQSRLTPIHRSTSIEPASIGEYRTRSHRSPTVLQISSKMKNNPPVRYQSSIFIDQTHTNRKSPERLHSNLYLDPQTGIVYRYQSDAPRIHHYQPSPTRKLYECGECGAITTYHHRHHIKSSIKRVPANVDDQGYESGTQRRSRKHRYVERLSPSSLSSSSSSSGSDSELSPTYQEMLALNRAYNRAENIRQQSRHLSRYIVRQLKLTLATL